MHIILDMKYVIPYVLVIMYLRASSRKNRDGTTVTYLQIAENRWNAEKKRSETKIICTLGRADGKAKERLKQLAASIRRQASFEEISELEPGWQFITSWVHGPFHVISRLWDRLGIRQILEKALDAEDREVPFERSIFAMVANRCLAPASKLSCYESWLRDEVYFPEGRSIALHHLYRAMDFLAAHKEEIEEELYWQLADLLNLDVDLIFYDTTSISFEIDEEDEGEDALRQRGYSKSGRGDLPQVVVGLAVTRDGFPVKSWVFPGNTADVTTVERVKEELRGWRLNRCLFVADAGMVSEDNLRTLARGGSSYVVAMPCRKGSEVVTEVLRRRGRFRQAEKRDGIWVIRTNDEGLDSEDLALAYKQLMRVEEAWKTMKSGLEIEPVYHRTPDRIRAHVFLCVLALLIERVAEDACKAPWPRIRRTLRSIKVAQLLTSNGMLYQRSPVQKKARNILKTLKVKPPPEILEAKQ